MNATLEQLISLCKRRGFIYPGSELYGGLAGTYDYGPLGVLLKRNIENAWWQMFVTDRDDMYGIDAAIIMNPNVWVASGHVEGFKDPLVECKNCHSRYRADVDNGSLKIADIKLVQDQNTDIQSFQVSGTCPNCGALAADNFTDIKTFNMMFKTQIGAVESEDSIAYLRPETAQGMFVNFKNVVDSVHPKLPFGLAQIGKAFRNEIAPRDFVFRSREFNQMEIEYFVDPRDEKKITETFDGLFTDQMRFLETLGLPADRIHKIEVPKSDRAHYSKRSVDTEFDFPFGQKELLGLAYRTDFDLKAHSEKSGVDLSLFDEETKDRVLPHCIEPTFGVERLVLAVLTSAYAEEDEGDDKRIVLKLPKHLAPYKACVSPLLKNKPELVAKAREVFMMLKKEIGKEGGSVTWDDNGNIGKRYRRQDEIGTPACVVIDFDTMGETPELADTVTVRNRDTMEQTRMKISELVSYLK